MDRKIKILCSCGTGVACCNYVAKELMNFLNENDIEAEIIECKVEDVYNLCGDADLVISTAQLPPKILKPRISAVPFITGNKLEETKKVILDSVKEILAGYKK